MIHHKLFMGWATVMCLLAYQFIAIERRREAQKCGIHHCLRETVGSFLPGLGAVGCIYLLLQPGWYYRVVQVVFAMTFTLYILLVYVP
ncbi:MAG TPA: hypothetical protein VHR86_03435, partial [Armatimonadota bacterium]|nr:hypothetical protein [Armatimonadota bacterium]